MNTWASGDLPSHQCYSATDGIAIPGASHPSARDGSCTRFCTGDDSESSRASKEGSVSLFTAVARRLRIKRVPCVSITISIRSTR